MGMFDLGHGLCPWLILGPSGVSPSGGPCSYSPAIFRPQTDERRRPQTIFASLLASLAPVSAAGPRSSNPRIEGLICVRP